MSPAPKLMAVAVACVEFACVVHEVSAAEPTAPLIFVGDFESGVLDLEGQFIQSGNAPTITREQVRAGTYAMKTYLNRQASETDFRTEVVPRMPDVHPGDELWYGFSIFLPPSYETSRTWEVVAQWHDIPNDWDNLHRQNPPLQLGLTRDAGTWKITSLWDADVVRPGNVFEIDGVKTWDLGPYVRNGWTDWVFHIKWSYGSDGILEVWQNGTRVVDYRGPNSYNDLLGPYFKMGLYKGWNDPNAIDNVGERTLYHDELRIAGRDGSYDVVAPPPAGIAAWRLSAD